MTGSRRPTDAAKKYDEQVKGIVGGQTSPAPSSQ